MRVAGPLLVLFLLESDHGHARLGITATRKVANAVGRNRVRRCVREAFRKHREALPSWDLVVNVRAAAVRATTENIEIQLLDLIGRARRRYGARR